MYQISMVQVGRYQDHLQLTTNKFGSLAPKGSLTLNRDHLHPTNSDHHTQSASSGFLHRKCTDKGKTSFGYLSFTQAVHRHGPFRVFWLHIGSTQARPLEGFLASHRKCTGTTPLGFLGFTQAVHRYGPFRVSWLHIGNILGFTYQVHRHGPFRVS